MCVKDWSEKHSSPCTCFCSLLLPVSDRQTVPSPPSALIHSEHTCKECFSRPSVWYIILQSIHAASSMCSRASSLGYFFSLPRHPIFYPTYFSEQYQETNRLMVPVCITYPWSFKLLYFYVQKVTQKVAPYKLPQ